ncbi:hypothetical protein LIX60_11280 [Streptomyces sp. S07_1.15]|uniref:hypothetical protein n=1 Tax=Streptomyces sp. S07_1.15 TaxID=2873925 RepID=UPI001D15C4C3|nr:hypothetical protein [Streptomyces sp. S07_1.15]MCC3652038.1 hypothetical protein [Streptomyces sp. S07_1.15]
MILEPLSCPWPAGGVAQVFNDSSCERSFVQHDPMGPDFSSEGLDPDGWVWAHGVDYVAGWRSATDAGAELIAALAETGINTSEIESRPDTASDGPGVIRLALPVEAARAFAAVARNGTSSWHQAG